MFKCIVTGLRVESLWRCDVCSINSYLPYQISCRQIRSIWPSLTKFDLSNIYFILSLAVSSTLEYIQEPFRTAATNEQLQATKELGSNCANGWSLLFTLSYCLYSLSLVPVPCSRLVAPKGCINSQYLCNFYIHPFFTTSWMWGGWFPSLRCQWIAILVALQHLL